MSQNILLNAMQNMHENVQKFWQLMQNYVDWYMKLEGQINRIGSYIIEVYTIVCLYS